MAKNRILIIDDDLDILETMGSLLEFEGFEIHSADTVEAGIEMIETISPDLILLDVMFPEKKTRGFEAAGLIKEKHQQIPIFVISAINRDYAFDFSKEDVQVEEFINKPVKINRLVEMIRKYI
ncbi:MAG TPA: response regulator [Spirochaetia bacterium]|nr:response regulator [Spirochaetia bacterium]